MEALGREIAARFGAETCSFFARGSTALYALFVRIAEDRGTGEVIIPGICCETVALAAIYAGMTPVIVDVRSDDGCISSEATAARLSERTRAIIAVDLYGHAADLASLQALTRGRDVVLVEDLAHAVGGSDPRGNMLGTTLDYTLLSFADNKIIPGAGGALLRRAGAAFSVDDANLPAPRSDLTLRQLGSSLRNATHGLFDLARETSVDIAASFRPIVPHYRELIVRRTPSLDMRPVRLGFSELEHTRRVRYRNYLQYRERIRSSLVTVVDMHEGSMVWRCPLLAKYNVARALTDHLRHHGIHASNHYFPLDKLLDNTTAPGNAAVGSTIVNLWVDPQTDEADVQRAIELINNFRPA